MNTYHSYTHTYRQATRCSFWSSERCIVKFFSLLRSNLVSSNSPTIHHLHHPPDNFCCKYKARPAEPFIYILFLSFFFLFPYFLFSTRSTKKTLILKQLQKYKQENERLRAENRALTRVVSKLTTSAQNQLLNKQ